MKKQTKKSITAKLDKVCSQIVRKGICIKCGESQYDKLQCAHIFSRTYRSVRWDFLNLVCLCTSCHFWSHRNPLLFNDLVENYLSKTQYLQLKSRATSIKKWSLQEMIDLYNSLIK